MEARGRLPRLAARAERVLDGLEAGVSLSPDTLEAMADADAAATRYPSCSA